MKMHELPKTYRCHKCKNTIDAEEALHLYKRLGGLKPGFYYCKECMDKEIK